MATATTENAPVNPDMSAYPSETVLAAAREFAPTGTDFKVFADRVECTVAKPIPGVEVPARQLYVIPSGKVVSRIEANRSLVPAAKK